MSLWWLAVPMTVAAFGACTLWIDRNTLATYYQARAWKTLCLTGWLVASAVSVKACQYRMEARFMNRQADHLMVMMERLRVEPGRCP